MRLRARGARARVNRAAFMPRQHPPSLPVLYIFFFFFFLGAQTLTFNSLGSAAPERLGRAVPKGGRAGAVGCPGVAPNDLQTRLFASAALLLFVPRRWDRPPCNLYPNAPVQPEMAPD